MGGDVTWRSTNTYVPGDRQNLDRQGQSWQDRRRRKAHQEKVIIFGESIHLRLPRSIKALPCRLSHNPGGLSGHTGFLSLCLEL
jgi:hypothetical protein